MGMPAISLTALLAVSLAAPAAHAQDSDSSVKDARTWLGELPPFALDGMSFPYRSVIVEKLPAGDEEPTFVKLDRAKGPAATYLSIVDAASAAWDYKLNASRLTERAPVEALQIVTGADTVLVAPTEGPWRFVRWNGSKIVVLAEHDAPDARTEVALATWIRDALGWDGVVLAVRGEQILIGSSAALLATPELQALTVAGSARIWTLPEKRSGSGLLSLTDHHGAVGIFDVVLLRDGLDQIAVGTKIILEKKSANP